MKKIIAICLTLMLVLFLGACNENESKKEYNIEYVDNLTVEVGQNFDPRDYFKILDGTNVIDKYDVNLAIVSGSVNTVGQIEYSISYDGQTFSLVLNVVEKKNPLPKPDDDKDPVLIALEKALKQNYDNVTLTVDQAFTGTVLDSSGNEIENDFSIHEVNYMNVDKYHIVYEDTDETTLEFYVDQQEEYVYLYRQSGNAWQNTPLTYAQWESKDYDGDYVYADYYAKYVSPQSFSLQTSEFKVEGNKAVCIPTRLDLVGQKIFNVSDDNAVFTSITIEVENEVLKEIAATYDSTDEYGTFTSTIKYTYSNVGSTQIDLPNVEPEFPDVPEHIDPALATPLTELQKQALTHALEYDYTNYEFEYYYNEDDGYYVIQEKDSVVGYSYRIHQAISGYQNDSYDYYFEIQDVNADRKYYIYEVNENKQYVRTQLTTQQEIINYMPLAVSPAKLSLSVSSFGMVANQFVCTAEGLKKEVSNFTNLSGASLVSLVISLDAEERVQKIELLTKVDAASGTYYIEESYCYSNIGSAAVEIPTENTSVLKDMTEEQKQALKNAFEDDYSNVTIYDEYVGSTFYFAGSNIKTTVYDNYELVTDYYKVENDKYYEYKNGAYVEIPFHSDDKTAVSFDYYLPVPNFASVDLTKVSYNDFNHSYYISISDITMKDFIYYFDVEEILGVTFTGVEFVLDETGKLQKINLEAVDSENTYYVGYGLEYYDYGTTLAE